MILALVIGATIGGRYIIVRHLASGGMGAVYEARHTGTGRRVALKVVSSDLARRPGLLARFEQEARAAGSIESEHIAQVLDVGHDEALGAPFMALEYLSGEDGERFFARLGAVPPALALRIGVQACLGLEKAHAQGIIHRDVKPANLFFAERDGGEIRLKLLDFGIAKVLPSDVAPGAEAKPRGPRTRTGAVIGSPLYMSPEQARARGDVDHRTDIWSLGIVLYEALSGRSPFADSESIGDFVRALCSAPAPPIRGLAPWVHEGVAAAVERALVIDPGGRYQSAAEMRQALAAFLPQGAAIHVSMLASIGASSTQLPATTVPAVPALAPAGTGEATPAAPPATSDQAIAGVVTTGPPATPDPGPQTRTVAIPAVLGPPAPVPARAETAAPLGTAPMAVAPAPAARSRPDPPSGSVLGAAPPLAPPAPLPRRAARGGRAGVILAAAAVAAAGALGGAYAMGWLGDSAPQAVAEKARPVAPANAAAAGTEHVDAGAPVQRRADLGPSPADRTPAEPGAPPDPHPWAPPGAPAPAADLSPASAGHGANPRTPFDPAPGGGAATPPEPHHGDDPRVLHEPRREGDPRTLLEPRREGDPRTLLEPHHGAPSAAPIKPEGKTPPGASADPKAPPAGSAEAAVKTPPVASVRVESKAPPPASGGRPEVNPPPAGGKGGAVNGRRAGPLKQVRGEAPALTAGAPWRPRRGWRTCTRSRCRDRGRPRPRSGRPRPPWA